MFFNILDMQESYNPATTRIKIEPMPTIDWI